MTAPPTRVTLNEVLRQARKVLLAQGVGPGCEHEPALAVLWLECRGLAGLATLSVDVPAIRAAVTSPVAVSREASDLLELDAHGASAALLSPAAVDWLQAAGPRARVSIAAMRSPAWLLPALADRADAPALWLQARGEGGAMLLCAERAAGGPLRIRAWNPSPELAGRMARVDLGRGPPPPLADPPPVLDWPELERRRAAALRDGLLVDTTTWRRLGDLARESMVPESDSSRARGAGGGDDNS